MLLGAPSKGRADLLQRFATDDRANFVLFGNTTGLDCRDLATEKPVVGTVPALCSGLIPDTTRDDDLLWRSDDPASGQATASALITPAAARSTAVLKLPAGAQVVYARLYWAAQRVPLLGAGRTVSVERPGVFTTSVNADATRGSTTFPLALLAYYQSSADITRLVQRYGAGAYRISGIDTVDLALQQVDTLFIGWSVVVFYRLPTEPPRNLALFDGLDQLSSSGTKQSSLTVNNITAATTGVSAQLGVVAYAGNADLTGDQLQVNGAAITNAYNPANNFFNRTRTVLGALGPQAGDLPQLTGRPSSISGMDIDVVDISSAVANGSSQFSVLANTTTDTFFLGVVASAVGTIRPVLSGTTKTVVNLTRNDGRFLPGDVLEYTIATQNTGNDVGTNVMVTDVLPTNVTFVSQSIEVLTGANVGLKTDQTGDDQGDYNTATRTVTVRLGTGANATLGGTLAVNAGTSFRFRVTINTGATGTVSNQGTISSLGQTAQNQGSSIPSTWPTGNGQQPGQPTVITITTCASSNDCTPQAPYCDTTASPPQCICRDNNDCKSGVCNPLNKQCVECIPVIANTCDPNTVGGACLPTFMCGCLTNADCAGRTCNTATMTCAAINTDLSVSVTRAPAGTMVAPGTPLTYQLTVANKGSAAVTGAVLDTSFNPTQAASWTCTPSGGAQCPSPSGTGPIPALPNLPAGSSLLFTYTTTAAIDPASSALDFTATITPPRGYVDTNPTDNTATSSVLIGLPPMGPDLSVEVIEQKSPDEPTVTYTINVTDKGPGPAPGATVTYQIPPSTTVDIIGGAGWTCTQQDSQVVCTRTEPIAEGQTTSVQIVTHVNGGQSTVPVKVAVAATDSSGGPLTDPNPADNQVDRITELDRFYLSGGGLACSLVTFAPSTSAAGPALLFLLALLALALRRRARA